MTGNVTLRRSPAGLAVIVTVLCVLSSSVAVAAEPRQGPDGKVRVLYMGDAISLRYLTPYAYMRVEPLIEVTPVVSSLIVAVDSFGMEGIEMVKRSVRLYIPRNYRSLVDTKDVLILSDATLPSFSTDHLAWFARAVKEEGLAMVMAGGVESFHQGGWAATVIPEVLPVDYPEDGTGPGYGEVVKYDDELMRSISWKEGFEQIYFGGANRVEVKPGGVELAKFKPVTGSESPMMVVGDIGKGRGFAFAPDWTWGWGAYFAEWEYYGDFSCNLMLYMSRQEVPQDLEILHKARKQLLNLDISRGLLVSLFDFVERFGANPRPLEDMLDDVDGLRKEAEGLYMKHDFARALEVIGDAIDRAAAAEREGMRIKDAALLWIYLVEWLAVTATMMISGIAVWSLMIRRRYFKEVRSTRFAA